jgi:hypothetical protein
MTHRLRVSIYMAAILVLSPPVGAQQTPPAPAEEQEPLPVLAVPPGYKYEPRGRRDPFVNPIPKPAVPEPEIPIVRPPGLRGVLVSEANIIGIVTAQDPSMTVAVIQAPGNKTYFAARGDELYDAVVKEIQTDAVIFTVTGSPKDAKNPPREIVRKLRSTPGE